MSSGMSTYLPLHDAATLADVSLRTVQRWAKDGRIPSKVEGGRTLVSVPPELVATNRPDALLVEGLRASAEESSKVAALVGRHAEETALALKGAVEAAERRADRAEDRADRIERSSHRLRWAVSGLVAALAAAVAFSISTGRETATMADIALERGERLKAAETALEVAKADISARDTARQVADARALEAEDRARRFEAVVGIIAADECRVSPEVAAVGQP